MGPHPPIRLAPMTGQEDPGVLAAGFAGDREMAATLVKQIRSFLESAPRPDPWSSYLAWNAETAVGTCAFKSAPDASGAVEIAYFTFPAFENRGFAKAMIAALVEIAGASGASLVTASTLREDNASTGALRRQGFRFAGEVVDAEDGPVWRWEKAPRPA